LHPALLDEATAFGSFAGAQGHYLPLGYGRLTVYRPLPAHVYSHLRHRDSATPELLTCDLTLIDERGEIVIEISDFMLRRIDVAEISTAVGGESDAATEEVEDGDKVGIRPSEGGEAFARLLGGRIGPQVVATSMHLPTLISKVRQVNRSRLNEELGDRVLADGPGSPVLSATYVAPRTEVEKQLVQLWEECIGAVGVGVEHDFFDIGGNSLVASQLIGRIRSTFGVKLPMRIMFESPTIASMAAAIEASVEAQA
jgi:acyl carrier protein